MSEAKLTRNELVAIAKQIQNAQDRGDDHTALIAQLQSEVPYPKVEELFLGDYSAEYIVDFSLNWRADRPSLSTQEMIELVTKIIDSEGTESQLATMVEKFNANCLHPAKSDLIFYPDDYFDGNLDPSPSEIVEKAFTKE